MSLCFDIILVYTVVFCDQSFNTLRFSTNLFFIAVT